MFQVYDLKRQGAIKVRNQTAARRPNPAAIQEDDSGTPSTNNVSPAVVGGSKKSPNDCVGFNGSAGSNGSTGSNGVVGFKKGCTAAGSNGEVRSSNDCVGSNENAGSKFALDQTKEFGKKNVNTQGTNTPLMLKC